MSHTTHLSPPPGAAVFAQAPVQPPSAAVLALRGLEPVFVSIKPAESLLAAQAAIVAPARISPPLLFAYVLEERFALALGVDLGLAFTADTAQALRI